MSIRLTQSVLLGAILLGVSAGCGSRQLPGGGGPSGPAPGTIQGTYVVVEGGTTAGRPVDGIMIGLFEERVSNLGNPYAPNQPQPIAQTVTRDGGTFAFRGLTARRYFAAPIGVRIYAPGKWVTVTTGRGAEVQLVGYANAPPPA